MKVSSSPSSPALFDERLAMDTCSVVGRVVSSLRVLFLLRLFFVSTDNSLFCYRERIPGGSRLLTMLQEEPFQPVVES